MNLDFCFHISYCVNNIKVWIRPGLYQQCIGRFMEWGIFCGTFWVPQNQLSSTTAYLSVVSDHLSPKCPVAASSRITCKFTKLRLVSKHDSEFNQMIYTVTSRSSRTVLWVRGGCQTVSVSSTFNKYLS